MRVERPEVKFSWENIVGVNANIDSILKVSEVSYGKPIKMDKLKFLRKLYQTEEHSPFEHTNFCISFDLSPRKADRRVRDFSAHVDYDVGYADLKDRIWCGGVFEKLYGKRWIEISGSLRDFIDFYLDLFRETYLQPELRRLVLSVGDFLDNFFGGGIIPNSYHDLKKPTDLFWFISLNSGRDVRQHVVDNRRIMLDIVCSRAISHQLIRHRSFSFMERSMRRIFFDVDYGFVTSENESIKRCDLASVEESWQNYQSLVRDKKRKKEEARKVLPIGSSTRLYMTGRLKDWKKFIHIRTRTKSKSQVEMVEIAEGVESILEEHNLIGGVSDV